MAAEQLSKGCFRALADNRSDECFVGVGHHAARAIRTYVADLGERVYPQLRKLQTERITAPSR